jgi:hypothetical protein
MSSLFLYRGSGVATPGTADGRRQNCKLQPQMNANNADGSLRSSLYARVTTTKTFGTSSRMDVLAGPEASASFVFLCGCRLQFSAAICGSLHRREDATVECRPH